VIRSPRRRAGRSRVVLVGLGAIGGLLLVGCGAGQLSQTAKQQPTIDGQNAHIGTIALRDIALAYPERGVYEEGSNAPLDMIVVNEGDQPDALVEVRSDVAERVTFATSGAGESPEASATGTASPTGSPSETGTASPSGPATPSPSATAGESTVSRIPIPAASLVAFRDGGPAVTLEGLTRELRPGDVMTITFVFERAGSVTTDVAVAVPEEEIEPAPTVPGVEPEEGVPSESPSGTSGG
jgi:copper(I)-binding protein